MTSIWLRLCDARRSPPQISRYWPRFHILFVAQIDNTGNLQLRGGQLPQTGSFGFMRGEVAVM